MKTILNAVLVLVSFALSGANARAAGAFDDVSEGHSVCFSRTYSESHLAAHPAQTVSKMHLKFYKNKYTTNWIALEFRATVRPFADRSFSKQMSCYEKGESLHCGIDCDGGQAMISRQTAPANGVLFKNLGKIVLHGGCGSGPENFDDWVILVNNPQGDNAFSLEESECKTDF